MPYHHWKFISRVLQCKTQQNKSKILNNAEEQEFLKKLEKLEPKLKLVIYNFPSLHTCLFRFPFLKAKNFMLIKKSKFSSNFLGKPSKSFIVTRSDLLCAIACFLQTISWQQRNNFNYFIVFASFLMKIQ